MIEKDPPLLAPIEITIPMPMAMDTFHLTLTFAFAFDNKFGGVTFRISTYSYEPPYSQKYLGTYTFCLYLVKSGDLTRLNGVKNKLWYDTNGQ